MQLNQEIQDFLEGGSSTLLIEIYLRLGCLEIGLKT